MHKFILPSYSRSFIVAAILSLAQAPVFADTVMMPRSSGTYMPSQGIIYPYNVNRFNSGMLNNSGVQYYQYNNPYASPYGTVYGGYYPNAGYYPGYYPGYAPGYVGSYNMGGISTPVFGAPQLIGGGMYGISFGGVQARFWRAPSGFYYPWAGGYGYTSYPILVVPPSNNTATQTLPPVSTIVSDLNTYLDKAKQDGKIDQANYQSLKQRAKDLLSKEKSLAYEEGGTIDPDQEAEIRRDIEGLSAEVARRVQP